MWWWCDVKAATETPKDGTKPSAATEVRLRPFMARDEHLYTSRGGLWRVWTWLVGSEMGVTHGLPFECATSKPIGVLGMCLYIAWLDVYHFLSAQSLKCTFPTPVSTKFSKRSKLVTFREVL